MARPDPSPHLAVVADGVLNGRAAGADLVAVMARRQGVEVRVLTVADIEYNPLASVLVARRGTLDRQPDLVRAVTAATRLRRLPARP